MFVDNRMNSISDNEGASELNSLLLPYDCVNSLLVQIMPASFKLILALTLCCILAKTTPSAFGQEIKTQSKNEKVLLKDCVLNELPLDAVQSNTVSAINNLVEATGRSPKKLNEFNGKKGTPVEVVDSGSRIDDPDYAYKIVNGKAHEVTFSKNGEVKFLKVRLLSGEEIGKVGWVPATAAVELVKITRTRWRPLADHNENESILEIYYDAGATGRAFSIGLYVIELATPSGVGLVPALPAPAPGTRAPEKQPVATLSVVSKLEKEEMAELRISKGYPRACRLQVGVFEDPADPSKTFGSLSDVPVSEFDPLSFELQTDAPLANSRKDRVELWLRRYREDIRREAEKMGVSGVAIAGPIAWEAIKNVKKSPGRGFGPGAVHVTDSTLQAGVEIVNPFPISFRGFGVARQVEDKGLLPKLTIAERIEKLKSPQVSIQYIAAILGSYVKIAKDEYTRLGKEIPHAGPHSDNAPLLANFYQGKKFDTGPHTGKFLDLINAHDYFADKARTNADYKLRTDPEKHMDAWVEKELEYLRRAISNPGQ